MVFVRLWCTVCLEYPAAEADVEDGVDGHLADDLRQAAAQVSDVGGRHHDVVAVDRGLAPDDAAQVDLEAYSSLGHCPSEADADVGLHLVHASPGHDVAVLVRLEQIVP